jgi:hypothetical protein
VLLSWIIKIFHHVISQESQILFHIDKRTTMVVNEIGRSTDSIMSKTS